MRRHDQNFKPRVPHLSRLPPVLPPQPKMRVADPGSGALPAHHDQLQPPLRPGGPRLQVSAGAALRSATAPPTGPPLPPPRCAPPASAPAARHPPPASGSGWCLLWRKAGGAQRGERGEAQLPFGPGRGEEGEGERFSILFLRSLQLLELYKVYSSCACPVGEASGWGRWCALWGCDEGEAPLCV